MTPRVIYFDGACAPINPGGWMAWAWVALAADGREITHAAAALAPQPTNTNNQAEYIGLIAALTWLQGHGWQKMLVRGDSQLIIRHMTGIYQVRSPGLLPLYQQARTLADRTGVQFEWVRREINARADAYSAAALPGEAQRYG